MLAHCPTCDLYLRPTDACLHMAAFPAAASIERRPDTGEQGRNALASGAPVPLTLHSSTDTQGARHDHA